MKVTACTRTRYKIIEENPIDPARAHATFQNTASCPRLVPRVLTFFCT